MKEKRIIHKGWIEWRKATEWQKLYKKKVEIKQIFGKFQYIYSSKKGEISLILLKNYNFINNNDVWEICELSSNNLFEDVERFSTKKSAVKRIKELLK